MRAVVLVSLTSVISRLLMPRLAVAQQIERYALRGDEVAIYNLAGQVTIESGQGEVSVQVARAGSNAAQLKAEVGDIAGRETLRIRYPSDHITYPPMGLGSSTRLPVRSDGTFSDDGWDSRERGQRVTITGAAGGLEAHADLLVQVPAGRQVGVYLAVGKVSVANVNGELSVDAHDASVVVRGFRGKLNVDVGSGSVQAADTEGELSIDTGSGSVDISHCKGAHLSVDTGSGDVTATDLDAAAVAIETGSGDVRLAPITAPAVSVETGSGSVNAELRADVRELSIETGSGDVSLKAPPNLGGQIEIETSNGDIETDFALQVTRHAPDHVSGQIGDGRGTIAIETGSGGVKLLKSSP